MNSESGPGSDIWDRIFAHHPLPVEIERGERVFLYDTAGKRYFDVNGGPFAVSLGHNHPKVKAAIVAQLDQLCYGHPMVRVRRKAELCETICSVAPPGFNAAYPVSGGSEAVETAIKIARQYHVQTGNVGKHKVVSYRNSYHGMTLATMSLSGNPGTNRHYDPLVFAWPKIDQYSDYRRPADVTREEWGVQVAKQLERVIYFEGEHTVAAFIATPHGCGPDYGVVPPDSYWRELRRICDAHDVLLIADEVVTGFGRTGKWFGMDNFSVDADIMTFAKGIGSSYVPLGAVIVSDRVNAPFADGTYFIHGFTNNGHLLACAAGIATIEVIRSDGLVDIVATRSVDLFGYAEQLRAHPSVADVRGWGLFMVIELIDPSQEGRSFYPPDRGSEKRFQDLALENGLIFYSSLYGPERLASVSRGLPMYITPPFCITAEEVADMMTRIDLTLSLWEQDMARAASSRP